MSNPANYAKHQANPKIASILAKMTMKVNCGKHPTSWANRAATMVRWRSALAITYPVSY
jgi:hypothetical protein